MEVKREGEREERKKEGKKEEQEEGKTAFSNFISCLPPPHCHDFSSWWRPEAHSQDMAGEGVSELLQEPSGLSQGQSPVSHPAENEGLAALFRALSA